ncbi:hypothetical protein [Rhodococcus sp. MALMAid1271]|uniref:hypothetical protein n=1 Tax=Rhodococcus sp. MALMAid1271 TaxID=3411744 RepID=UPI003BA3D8EC
MTVCAPLKLGQRETISPAELGRTLCTEVAEQVPYWVAVLTPAERPLLGRHAALPEWNSTTLALPHGPRRVLLLAALGSAVCTWQRNSHRGSSAGVLVDLDLYGTGAVHPIRLPAVGTDALAMSSHPQRLVDEVARRLDSVPNAGRDYALARNYPMLAARGGAQILVRDGAPREPSGEHTIEIDLVATDAGTAAARVSWAGGLQGVDELLRLWSTAIHHLAATPADVRGSSAA